MEAAGFPLVPLRRSTKDHRQGYYTDKGYANQGVKIARSSDIKDDLTVDFSTMPLVEAPSEVVSKFALQKGDFVITRSGSGSIGKFGFVTSDEQAIFASYLIRFRFGGYHPGYLRYCFQTSIFTQALTALQHGGANQNVHAEDIKNILLPKPPLDLQAQIAERLDKETARLEKLVRQKQRLLALLSERRSAVINEAISPGRDSMEPATSRPLWAVAGVQPSNVDKEAREGETPVALCNYVDVYYNERIRSNLDLMKSTASQAEIEKFLLRKNDILVTKDSEDWRDIGIAACIESVPPLTLCGYHLYHVRPSVKVIDPQYLFWALRSRLVLHQIESQAHGVTRYGIDTSSLRSVRIPVPKMVDQQRFASRIDQAVERIEALSDRLRRSIDLLIERRQALITDCVMGLDQEHLEAEVTA